ncbi:hypothetical protein [Marinobacter sp. LN3S78]|uniref:hypothetical protein n=1 Tax=Marinobacter sp. LN3S78 TaxID=3382300 RepID=UPI00387B6BE9
MKTQTDFTPTLSATLRFCTAVLFGLMLSGLAQAASLTEDQVQSFIDSMHDTEKLREEFPELDTEMEPENHDMGRPISSSLSTLDDSPEARDRLEEIVEDHGFDNIEQWADVGDRVFIATMAISIQDMPPEQRKMVESMANPDIDPEAHEATQRGMNEMARNMRNMLAAADRASQEDIKVVRPYVDQFRALGED